MKKIKFLSVVMAAFLLLTVPAFANTDTFNDVTTESHPWAVEAIENMADLGIITGYTDGSFKPNNVVTKLESLVLTARTLGVDSPENERLLEFAVDKYSETLEDFELNFGSKEICYLLLKGVISEDELVDYIGKNNISAGMKRYEIAVLLTKALFAEDEVSKNVVSTMEFADINDIPAYAKKYVEYVSTNGIMNGTGDNMFSPNGDVTRAQIAVLMDKIYKMSNYVYIPGQVTEMDYSTRLIKVKNTEQSVKYNLTAGIILKLEGVEITVNDVLVGYDAVVTLKNDKLYSIDFITPLIEKEVNGVVVSKSTGIKNTITFHVVGDNDVTIDTSVKETYPLSSEIAITYDDETATMSDVTIGSYINVSIKKGEVATLKCYPKTKTFTGRVSGVDITPLCKLDIELDNETAEEYLLSNEVTVTKNGKEAAVVDIVAGDTVSVTTVYDRITKIVATSRTQQKSGVIVEVIISASPKLTVKTDGGDITYPVDNFCEITIPGKSNATFYDLRVGEAITFTLEGETVKNIATTTSEGITQISGIVSSVNVSYGVIQVTYTDINSGVSVTVPVFVNSKAIIIDIQTGKTIKIGNITEGSKITAFGINESGIFEATTVNVSSN